MDHHPINGVNIPKECHTFSKECHTFSKTNLKENIMKIQFPHIKYVKHKSRRKEFVPDKPPRSSKKYFSIKF